MSGTFVERITHLMHAVGTGRLRGTIEVDQVYAHNQHEHPEYKHPDGGEAFYLTKPLFEHMAAMMQHLANRAITEDGTAIHDAMADNMERMSREVYLRAPWEFGDLRASGHPSVTQNGEVKYDRPPNVGRLNDAELRVKNRLRYLFDPHRYDGK